MKKTLFIGYGNLDRQDDGVAWHIMLALLGHFDIPLPDDPDDGICIFDMNPSFLFLLQLTPETAEEIARHDRVCFIDAHTGDNTPQGIHITKIEPEFQNSAFTHHMKPETCLSLANSLYGGSPEAVLLTVQGVGFEFSRNLNKETQALIPLAVDEILAWADTN